MDIIKYYYWMLDAALTFTGWHSLAGRSGQLPGSVSEGWMTENVSVGRAWGDSSVPRDTCRLHQSQTIPALEKHLDLNKLGNAAVCWNQLHCKGKGQEGHGSQLDDLE